MLTDDEIETIAQQHIKENYPKVKGLLRSTRYSKPDGIYYHPPDHRCCDGGFFVSRKNGEVWSDLLFLESPQHMLDFYDEGWRKGLYRLKVEYVADALQFAELIVKNRLTYTLLELEHDVVWSRNVRYDVETVLARIKSLPCSFLISAFTLREILPVLKRVASVDYSYAGLPSYDWHPEKYTPEQLGPQWD